jgi:hypothetical protein
MRALRLLVPLVLALAAALSASPAAARVVIGMGEQQPSMFSDPHWIQLGMPDARYLTAWDTLEHRRQRERLDQWMAAADAVGARVAISFQHSRRERRSALGFPKPRQFKKAFLAFRERYPEVRDWIVWNEANHPRSLSAHRPGLVAGLFDIVARNCRRCRVVGADVLDITGMTQWVHAFRRKAEERPRIWGLHNYIDAQHGRSSGTRELLAATRGKVWFTETGGWILRRKYHRGRIVRVYRSTPRHAARATKHVLRLACLSKRIQRVYLYNWQAPPIVTTWDSGFVGPHGTPRPAYHVLLRQVRRAGGPYVRCR